MWYYVYVLKSKKGKLYKGFTNDVKRRLSEHNRGEVAFTKPYRPWELVHFSAFLDEKLAKNYEKYLKSGSGRSFLERHLI
jgi:putative endonuclease